MWKNDSKAIKATLDRVRARCDNEARLRADPVGIVHRYEDPLDQEIVGLVAACIAFGNVKTIRAKLGDLLAQLRPDALDLLPVEAQRGGLAAHHLGGDQRGHAKRYPGERRRLGRPLRSQSQVTASRSVS